MTRGCVRSFVILTCLIQAVALGAPAVAQEKPRYGGELVFVVAAEPPSFDISSDLEELARTPMVVVCAGGMGDIFRRNALNLGLEVVQSAEAVADARDGDELTFDPSTRRLTNETQGRAYEPVSLVRVVRTRPVSVCVAVIVTPGSTAPLWSRAVPLMLAVA